MMITFNVEYEVNGRTVSAERFGDEFMEVIMEQLLERAKEHFREQIEDRVSDLRCKIHNQEPQVTVNLQHDRSTQQFAGTYHIEGCCQEFTDEVAKLLTA